VVELHYLLRGEQSPCLF